MCKRAKMVVDNDVIGVLREAWHSLGTMSRDEAMTRYLGTVATISPHWESISPGGRPPEEEEGEGGGGGGGVGPVVSRMADQEEQLAEEEKTVFDWCKEGRLDQLQTHISHKNINTTDTEVCPFQHTHTHYCCYVSGDDSAALGV